MDSHTLLWLTTPVMTAGGLLILLTGKRRTPSEELHTVLHGIVPLIAACSYFAMASGQGAIVLGADAASAGTGAGRIFYFARYIDWTFTTPLLLVTLSMTAMHAGPKRAGAIAGVVLADVMVAVERLTGLDCIGGHLDRQHGVAAAAGLARGAGPACQRVRRIAAVDRVRDLFRLRPRAGAYGGADPRPMAGAPRSR